MKAIIIALIVLISIPSVFAIEYARPDQDLNVGPWNTAPLYSKINEVIPNDATDYIYDSTNSVIWQATNMSLSGITAPTRKDGHVLKYRFRVTGFAAFSNPDFRIRLFQGDNLIVNYTQTTFGGVGWFTWTQTLQPSQAELITDYSNLTVEVSIKTPTAFTFTKELDLTWVQFYVPTNQRFMIQGNGIFRIIGNGIFRIRGGYV